MILQSYGSALTAFSARNGTKYATWGAKGLTIPSSCSPNSGATVSVQFNVNATTIEGGKSSRFIFVPCPILTGGPENIFITGSVDTLKDWSPDDALKLDPANYPIWQRKCHFLLTWPIC